MPSRQGSPTGAGLNWEALGAIGEVVGAGGVIATLVYLAYQIRQNTEQLEQSILSARASAVNASQVTLRENRQSIFEDAEMAEIFLRGNRSPETLSELEALRYRLLMQNVTEAMLEIFSQTAVTNFSPETWETQGRTLVLRVMGTPGGHWFWQTYSDNYPAAFRRAVEDLIGPYSD
jgi:hypothetical protein